MKLQQQTMWKKWIWTSNYYSSCKSSSGGRPIIALPSFTSTGLSSSFGLERNALITSFTEFTAKSNSLNSFSCLRTIPTRLARIGKSSSIIPSSRYRCSWKDTPLSVNNLTAWRDFEHRGLWYNLMHPQQY